MKVVRVITWILAIVFVVIQFIPTKHNQSNTVPESDFMVTNKVPTSVMKTIRISCYDCHSGNTSYPWYNKLQPMAWYLQHHINEGKDELNFNEWGNYSNRRKKSKLRSIISQIEENEMPLSSYTLLHKDAILSNDSKTALIDYIKLLKNDLE